MIARAMLSAALAVSLALAVVPASASPERWRSAGWKTDFAKATVPLSEILAGGPPRDGIPPIDRPMFKLAREIADLPAREPVIRFLHGGEARAYPLRIMTWHEIVNDTVAGTPVAVTYCPLCNASLVFDRRVEGKTLDFGTTGLLRHSDLVMWDRATESWWQQFTGEAIVGQYAGTALKMLPSTVVSFGEFAKAHPDGQVLVPEQRNLRPYERNPYAGYDQRSAPYPLFDGDFPKGLPAMARVAVARGKPKPVAVALSHLVERQRIEVDGFVFSHRPGVASALDTSDISQGRDVGVVEVTDTRGKPAVHDVTFAFVLHAFEPEAEVITEAGRLRLSTGEVIAR